jgi:hypothetical protein
MSFPELHFFLILAHCKVASFPPFINTIQMNFDKVPAALSNFYSKKRALDFLQQETPDVVK